MSYFQYPEFFNKEYIQNAYSEPETNLFHLSKLREQFYQKVKSALEKKEYTVFIFFQNKNSSNIHISDKTIRIFIEEIVEKFGNKNPQNSNITIHTENGCFTPNEIKSNLTLHGMEFRLDMME